MGISNCYGSVICSQQDSAQAPSHCAYNLCSQTMPELAGTEKIDDDNLLLLLVLSGPA